MDQFKKGDISNCILSYDLLTGSNEIYWYYFNYYWHNLFCWQLFLFIKADFP